MLKWYTGNITLTYLYWMLTLHTVFNHQVFYGKDPAKLRRTHFKCSNIFYLTSVIFGRKWILNKLAWFWISIFLIVPILTHIWKAYNNVLDLAGVVLHQSSKTLKWFLYKMKNIIHYALWYLLCWRSIWLHCDSQTM